MNRVILNNGVAMPWLGLGLYKVREGEDLDRAVATALEAGYRSFDTASMYGNEAGTGRALRAGGVPREELFIATKVWNTGQGYDETLRAFEASLSLLGADFVDLYLIHWPVSGLYNETWRAMERIYREGGARAIGVCNFTERHLGELLARGSVVPVVNQVEFHPLLFQKELLAYCEERGIRLEAWRPLTRGTLLTDPTILELARSYDRTPAQVMLRWDLQHGVITIPKSVTPSRIRENAAIFDFTLSNADMTRIDALDRGERLGPDPDSF